MNRQTTSPTTQTKDKNMTQTQAARILGIAAAAMRKRAAAADDYDRSAQIGSWKDNLGGNKNSYIQQLQRRYNTEHGWLSRLPTWDWRNPVNAMRFARGTYPDKLDRVTNGELAGARSAQASDYAKEVAPDDSAPHRALSDYYEAAGKDWNYPTYLRTGKLPEKAYLENEPEKWPEVIRAMSPEERQKVFQNARTMVDNRRTAPNQAVS